MTVKPELVIFPCPVQHRITVQIVEIEQHLTKLMQSLHFGPFNESYVDTKELQYHLDVLKHLIS
jgi:hypothetical protein